MNESADERLDDLLEQWARESLAPEERLRRLEARILDAAAELSEDDLDDGAGELRGADESLVPGHTGTINHTGHPSRSERPLPRSQRARRWLGAAVALTLVVGLGISIGMLRTPDDVGGKALVDRAPTAVLESSSQLAAVKQINEKNKSVSQKLHEAMIDLYPHGLLWLAESDIASAVGTASDVTFEQAASDVHADPDVAVPEALPKDLAAEGTDGLFNVQLVARYRSAGSQEWSTAWSVNVITRAQEWVRYAPEFEPSVPGMRVSLWTYPVQDDMVSVESHVRVEGPYHVEQSEMTIQEHGVPKSLLTVRDDRGELRIFQTVDTLPQNAGVQEPNAPPDAPPDASLGRKERA